MAIADAKRKAIANCESCGAVVGVALSGDGSITPLGSADGCACGCRDFRVLR